MQDSRAHDLTMPLLFAPKQNSPRVEVQPPWSSNCARTPWQRLAYSGAAWASWAARWAHDAERASAEPHEPRATQTLAQGGWRRQGRSCGQPEVPSGATGAGRGYAKKTTKCEVVGAYIYRALRPPFST